MIQNRGALATQHASSGQGLVRLDELVLPSHLSGKSGANRADGSNFLGVDDDVSAVLQFLREYSDSPATYRAYRKEIERCLLWATIERRKPFSSLTREDFSDYSLFLSNPSPRARWCGPRGGRSGARFTAGWRPFVGPLSSTAQKTALVIINACLNYLVQARYLAGNPLGLLRQRHRQKSIQASRRQVMARSLDDIEWQAVVASIESMPIATPSERATYERARFIVALLHFLALRVGELASHCMGDFVRVRKHWQFFVTGKGDKDAELPVNSAMLQALSQYRRSLGLPDYPEPHDRAPLIVDKDRQRAITARRITQILKDVFERAAQRLEPSSPHSAKRLRQASPHWLRHTSLTRQSELGIPLVDLKANARHSKVDTTMIYIHSDEDARHQGIEQLTWTSS